MDDDTGLAAVEEIRPLVPPGVNMAQVALHWILMHDACTVAIPGARNAAQAQGNAASSEITALTDATMAALARIYAGYAKPQVYQRW